MHVVLARLTRELRCGQLVALVDAAKAKSAFLSRVGIKVTEAHILHPTSYILHPTSYILHPTSYILQVTEAHALVVRAYTEETPLYGELNATCRAATHTAEQKLRVYGAARSSNLRPIPSNGCSCWLLLPPAAVGCRGRHRYAAGLLQAASAACWLLRTAVL